MAVTVLLELQAQGDKVDALLNTFKEILPDTRAYDGFVGIELVQNQDDPTNVILIERWQTRQHYEKYLAWRTETGALEALGAMLAGAPSIRYFDTKDV